MKKTVFYSWQSDLPNATNRNLIEEALREAAAEIAADESIGIDPVIDRDTLGSAGAPDIAVTIFKKISDADLFVADVSFATRTDTRSFPNSNVLVELGYALHAKGHEALVLVFNKAFGRLENLPFDLKMRRILTYHFAEDASDRGATKAELVKDFKAALLGGFASVQPSVNEVPITEIIEQNPPNKLIQLRRYLDNLLERIVGLEPKMYRDGGTAEELIGGISATESIALSLAEVSKTIALMDDVSSAQEIFKWFGKLLERYEPLPNADNRTSKADGDFYKFLGHELFVIFIAPFYREGKFDILAEILAEQLKVGPNGEHRQTVKERWQELYGYSLMLADESKKNQRKSVHADLLKQRHTDGSLAKEVPFSEFKEVDFLLYLHGAGDSAPDEYHSYWYPPSVLYADWNVPEFVNESKNRPYALKICRILGISLEEFQRRLFTSRKLGYDSHSPIRNEDIEAIGTEGVAKFIT
jgi:hypothetical protein